MGSIQGFNPYTGYSSYGQTYGPPAAQNPTAAFGAHVTNYTLNAGMGGGTASTSYKPKKKKKGLFGKLKSIGKGIIKGAVNTVKSLATPKGLLMAAAGIGLTVATGGAALPFLVGAGVAMGGAKAVTSAMAGDWEGVGEGLFTVGASVAGARLGPKSLTNAGTGETFALNYSTGTRGAGIFARAKSTVLDNFNLLRGNTQLVGSNDTRTTLFNLARGNASHFLRTDPLALGVNASGRGLLANGQNRVNGFRPGTFQNVADPGVARTQALNAIRPQFEALQAKVAAGGRLTPWEQGQFNFFALQLGEKVSLGQRLQTPFQLLYGGARNNPGGASATGGLISNFAGQSQQA